DPCDRAFDSVDPSHAEVSNLHDFFVGGEQQVLRLDVAMDHAAFVCVRKTGANLFQIKQDSLKRQWARFSKRKQIAAGKILENDVMKSRAGEIDGGTVSETVYDIWVSNAIECNGLVLKIRDERSLQLSIGRVLKI